MTAPQPARELTEAMADTVRFHALAAKMRRSFTEGHGGWWDARVTARDIRQWDAALRSLPYGRTTGAAGTAGPGEEGGTPRPLVVCLCGSTRFCDEFREANLRLTLEGVIVLSIGCDTKSDADLAAAGGLGKDPERVKRELDELHRRKIDLADEVLIVSRDGYFGESTAREIAYAVEHGKPVRFAEDAAHRRAWNAGLIPVVMCGCTQIPEMPLCEHQRQPAGTPS